MDNLNTHNAASLYATFPAAEARRIAKRLELHHTPTHASWLNTVEIEVGALTRQCLDRRIGDIDFLRSELTACVEQRNADGVRIKWLFDVDKARRKIRAPLPGASAEPVTGGLRRYKRWVSLGPGSRLRPGGHPQLAEHHIEPRHAGKPCKAPERKPRHGCGRASDLQHTGSTRCMGAVDDLHAHEQPPLAL